MLETHIRGEPRTVSGLMTLKEVTENRAELLLMAAALRRVKSPCEIVIYTSCKNVAYAITHGWLKKWKENGYRTAKDQKIKNKEEWQEIEQLLRGNAVTVILQESHTYTSWIETEVKRKVG